MPLTLAFAGAGMISAAHGEAARLLGYPVTHVASRTPQRAAERAAALGAVACTYDELPAGADVVVVATPPHRHAADALAALAAGAAVVVEKPLCTTLADADALVAAAEAHGQRLLYAENLAYAPIVIELLARIATIGPLTHLSVRSLNGSRPAWGGFLTDEWGGGALFDLGVHPIAVALLAAAAARPSGRAAWVSARLEGGDGHSTDEHAEVTVGFDTGLAASIESSWRPGPLVWDAQAASVAGVVRAELLPRPGLEHNGEPVALAEVTAPVPELEEYGYLGQLHAFAGHLATRTRPAMDAVFGRLVLDVVCAAYQSAGLGGATIPLPFGGPRDLTPLQLWRRGTP